MASTPRPVSGAPTPTPHLRKSDGVALIVFTVLILLGLIAVAVSFARM